MNLTDVQEKELGGPRVLPAQGKWHPGTITTAEAGTSRSGNFKIAVQVTLTAEEHAGYVLYGNFMTDGRTQAAKFSKKHLMGCGIDVNNPQEDSEVASQLLGKDVFVQVRHEIIKDKDANDNYTQIRYDTDENGKQIPAKKAVPVAFSLYDPTGEKKAETPKKEEKPAQAAAAQTPPADGKPLPPWKTAKPAAK